MKWRNDDDRRIMRKDVRVLHKVHARYQIRGITELKLKQTVSLREKPELKRRHNHCDQSLPAAWALLRNPTGSGE